jgi:hypothetical protein
MEQIEVVPLIKREMKNNKITVSDMARGLQTRPSTINGILNRPTMRVQRLAELSEFFGHNFFREIANNLPGFEPEESLEPYKKEIARLENRVKELEVEVNFLRQTIKDMSGR